MSSVRKISSSLSKSILQYFYLYKKPDTIQAIVLLPLLMKEDHELSHIEISLAISGNRFIKTVQKISIRERLPVPVQIRFIAIVADSFLYYNINKA